MASEAGERSAMNQAQVRHTVADVAGVNVIEPVDELSAEVHRLLGTVALPLLALRRRLWGRLGGRIRGGCARLLQMCAVLEDAILSAWAGHRTRDKKVCVRLNGKRRWIFGRGVSNYVDFLCRQMYALVQNSNVKLYVSLFIILV